MSDETKVLAALALAGAAGLTQQEIHRDVFGGHRTNDLLRSLLGALRDDGAAECLHEAPAPGGDQTTLRWREIVNTHDAREAEMTKDNSGANTHPKADGEADTVDDWTPPEGEGWVKWEAICRMAEDGVPYGFALRQGKKFRAKQHWSKRELRAIPDEQYAWYGARRISRAYLSTAVQSGAIERRGEWCRLVRDPVRTPRMWMAAVYQVLGAAHPTLTGEFAPKPPKTLPTMLQEHLGRELLPEEFVRRRPGRGASWDPVDMKLHSRLLHPSDVELNEQRLNEYRARAEQAPPIQERPRFKASLPKARKRR